jgi:16S rRNA (uracil1498-N3)-methyltransferase
LKPQDLGAKTRRWEKIALAAAKQCGRKSFAKVYPPRTFEEAVASLPKDDLNLILWESEEKKSRSEAVEEKIRNQHAGIRVNLLAGPEGGLSMREAGMARDMGMVPVHLGEHILRSETAAIAAASFLKLFR